MSVLILPLFHEIVLLFCKVNDVALANKNLFCFNKEFVLLFKVKLNLPCVAQLTPEGGTTYPRGWFNLPQRWGKLSN